MCAAIAGPMRLDRIVPKIAIPTVAPVLRKNWVVAVATPRSRRITTFCTISVKTCIHMPRPKPNRAVARARSRADEDAPRRAINAIPTPMMTMPKIVNALYLPHLVMRMPTPIDVRIITALIGTSTAPDSPADMPSTPCA